MPSAKKSKLLYSVKTSHLQSSDCISMGIQFEHYYTGSDGKNYCKQSNDNFVYAEIAHPGVVEVDDGYMALFVGEQPALDNTKIGHVLNAPRNLALVKVSKDLSTVLSEGPVEEGSFYNFGGELVSQRNEGVHWLTNQPGIDESITRPKTFKLSEDDILLTYEVWTPDDYVRTEFLEINSAGQILRDKWKTCNSGMRVPTSDDGFMKDGKAVAYAGGPDGTIIRYEMCTECVFS